MKILIILSLFLFAGCKDERKIRYQLLNKAARVQADIKAMSGHLNYIKFTGTISSLEDLENIEGADWNNLEFYGITLIKFLKDGNIEGIPIKAEFSGEKWTGEKKSWIKVHVTLIELKEARTLVGNQDGSTAIIKRRLK